MPIFHDIDCHSHLRPLPALESGGYESSMRRPSEESIRTEFCDGPVPDADDRGTLPVEDDVAATTEAKLETSDRAELIERIKRGESPTWIPSRTVSHIVLSKPPQTSVTANRGCKQSAQVTGELISTFQLSIRNPTPNSQVQCSTRHLC